MFFRVMGLKEKFDRTLEMTTGTDDFTNSGVKRLQVLSQGLLDFRTIAFGFDEWAQAGPRVTLTQLNMPVNCVNLGPHCHPKGELSVVLEGAYFDARMDCSVMQEYPQGTVGFYNQWSTHRPLSHTGAKIIYFTFDGLIIPNKGEMSPTVHLQVLEKMAELRAPKDAVAYALSWMVRTEDERERLLTKLFSY